jgi:ribonuclease HIII
MDYIEIIKNCKTKLTAADLKFSEKDFKTFYILQIQNIGPLRIYNGKKKVTIDYSQIPVQFKQRIMDLIEPPSGDLVLGIDESGKGDFFGPLVIASGFVEDESKIRAMGVKDSKMLNDEKILVLAGKIKKKCFYNVIKISPEKYNQLYTNIGNLNKLLAWGHAQVIENSLEHVKPDYAISDKFAKDDEIISQLKEKGKKIKLVQQTKAEKYVSVAAASIIARAEFVLSLQKLSFKYGMQLPLGAGENVIIAGKKFVKKYGIEELKKVCKIHFSTYQKVIQ